MWLLRSMSRTNLRLDKHIHFAAYKRTELFAGTSRKPIGWTIFPLVKSLRGYVKISCDIHFRNIQFCYFMPKKLSETICQNAIEIIRKR